MADSFVAEKRITIDASVDAVWQALTDPALVKQFPYLTALKASILNAKSAKADNPDSEKQDQDRWAKGPKTPFPCNDVGGTVADPAPGPPARLDQEIRRPQCAPSGSWHDDTYEEVAEHGPDQRQAECQLQPAECAHALAMIGQNDGRAVHSSRPARARSRSARPSRRSR